MLQGGFVTKSEISVTLTNKENNVIYQCHGTNDALGETVVDTVTLTVMCKCKITHTRTHTQKKTGKNY